MPPSPSSQPTDSEIRNVLGLFNRNRLAEARAETDRLITLHSAFAPLHEFRGTILVRLGNIGEAIAAFEKSVALDPDLFSAWNSLGMALRRQARAEDAVTAYRKAIAIRPDYVEAHNNLGVALRALNRHAEAADAYRAAIGLDGARPAFHFNLANSLREMGERDAARESYRRAIDLQPAHAGAWRGLCSLHKFRAGDPLIEEMKQRLPPKGRDDRTRMQFCFALAKAHGDIGDAEAAFGYLAEGNALHGALTPYDPAKDKELFAAIREKFVDAPAPPSAIEPASIRPVFILGMPRSGTSLVEQILAGHSSVHGAGELNTLNRLCPPLLEAADPVLKSEAAAALRRDYLASLKTLGAAEKIITDKMPLNFRWIGFIATAFPEAPIIHLKRDPMAVCWSNFQQFFVADGLGYSWNLGDIGAYFRLYASLMNFWRERYPGRVYDVDYEKLTENPEAETRALLDHCGLGWEDSCLDFHRSGRAVRTASALQVGQSIYRGSSDAWRKFEGHLGPLKAALGDLHPG